MYAVGYKQVPSMLAGQFHHPRIKSSTEIPTESHAERVHHLYQNYIKLTSHICSYSIKSQRSENQWEKANVKGLDQQKIPLLHLISMHSIWQKIKTYLYTTSHTALGHAAALDKFMLITHFCLILLLHHWTFHLCLLLCFPLLSHRKPLPLFNPLLPSQLLESQNIFQMHCRLCLQNFVRA